MKNTKKIFLKIQKHTHLRHWSRRDRGTSRCCRGPRRFRYRRGRTQCSCSTPASSGCLPSAVRRRWRAARPLLPSAPRPPPPPSPPAPAPGPPPSPPTGRRPRPDQTSTNLCRIPSPFCLVFQDSVLEGWMRDSWGLAGVFLCGFECVFFRFGPWGLWVELRSKSVDWSVSIGESASDSRGCQPPKCPFLRASVANKVYQSQVDTVPNCPGGVFGRYALSCGFLPAF